MADNSDSRESDNNSWVMAGSEALPVEDLGSQEAAEAPTEAPSPTESRQPAPVVEKEPPEVRSEPEEPKTKPLASGPGVALDVPSEEETPKTSEPSPAPSPPQAKDAVARHAEEGSAPAPPGAPTFHKAGPPVAEDVEGLRRRKGREAPDMAAAAAGGPRAPGAREEGGQAIWLCGFLALLGLGILVALGVLLDNGDGPGEILTTGSSSDQDDLYARREEKAWPAPEAPGEAGLPVAKEEGLPPPLGTPRDPPNLEAMGALLDKMAKENQDIRLMQAELQAQKEELEGLLRKTAGEAQASTWQQQSLEAENARLKEALRREASSLLAARDEVRLLRGAKGAPPQGELGPKPEPPEAEVRRLRSSLESLGHDLAKAAQGDARPELSALQRKVAQALGREPGGRTTWKEGPKAKRGKEKRPGKEAKKAGQKPPGKKAKRPPREPPTLWQALAARPYKPPRGCSGVPECARKEGLAPVPKAAFLQAAQGFLSGRGWERHFAGLSSATESFFRPDGLFAHDRLSFLEFLDEAEDALEELAQGLGASEEEADDFEETVLRHLGRVTPRSSSSGGGGHHHVKDRGREGPGRKNSQENTSRAFGHH